MTTIHYSSHEAHSYNLQKQVSDIKCFQMEKETMLKLNLGGTLLCDYTRQELSQVKHDTEQQ